MALEYGGSTLKVLSLIFYPSWGMKRSSEAFGDGSGGLLAGWMDHF